MHWGKVVSGALPVLDVESHTELTAELGAQAFPGSRSEVWESFVR